MYPTPSTPVTTSMDNLPLIIIGLILLLILFLFYFKLYIDNNFVNGITLNIKDTIKNIFRINDVTPVSAPDIKPRPRSNKSKCKNHIVALSS